MFVQPSPLLSNPSGRSIAKKCESQKTSKGPKHNRISSETWEYNQFDPIFWTTWSRTYDAELYNRFINFFMTLQLLFSIKSCSWWLTKRRDPFFFRHIFPHISLRSNNTRLVLSPSSEPPSKSVRIDKSALLGGKKDSLFFFYYPPSTLSNLTDDRILMMKHSDLFMMIQH